MSRNRVKIVNPLAGQDGFVSLKTAMRWVDDGEAVFTSSARKKIRFLNGPARVAAIKAAELREKEKRAGYDGHRTTMTLEQMRHISIAQPKKALTESITIRRRRHKWPSNLQK